MHGGRYGRQLPEERGDELIVLSMYPCCIETNILCIDVLLI